MACFVALRCSKVPAFLPSLLASPLVIQYLCTYFYHLTRGVVVDASVHPAQSYTLSSHLKTHKWAKQILCIIYQCSKLQILVEQLYA